MPEPMDVHIPIQRGDILQNGNNSDSARASCVLLLFLSLSLYRLTWKVFSRQTTKWSQINNLMEKMFSAKMKTFNYLYMH